MSKDNYTGYFDDGTDSFEYEVKLIKAKPKFTPSTPPPVIKRTPFNAAVVTEYHGYENYLKRTGGIQFS